MDINFFNSAHIKPDLYIDGQYQRFIIGNAILPEPTASFKVDNIYIPIIGSPSFTNSEIRNHLLSGYRWIHETQSTETYGSYQLQKFLYANPTGINLMVFNNDGTLSIPGSTDATYIIQTAATNLSNAQILGSLSTGIVKNTTATGVLSIAIAGTDYYSPGHPTTLLDDYIPISLLGNLSVGTNSLSSLVLGSNLYTNNTSIGANSLASLVLSGNNTSVGTSSLFKLTSNSNNNTSVGVAAGFNLTSNASDNCFFGMQAGLNYTASSFNCLFGFGSGGNFDNLQNCCFFGPTAGASASNLTNAIAIGSAATVGASNTITMGNSSITNFNIPGLNFGLTANTIASTNTNGNLTITPNGTGIISLSSNVGIGTTTPNSQLHITGSGGYRTLTLFEVANNGFQFHGFGVSGGLVYNVGATTSTHKFYAATSSSASQELMRITATGTTGNSGCVGVNVGTTPSAGFHVVGGVQNLSNEDSCIRATSSALSAKIEIQNTTVSTGKLYELRSGSTGSFDITDRTASVTRIVINSTGTGILGAPDQVFSVTSGTADKPGGGTWGSFSDARIKDVLHPYRRGLNTLLQIDPVIYKYNAASQFPECDQKLERIGIIAQDIENILPECVTNQEARGFSDLRVYDASPLTYVMMNAIKELNEKIQLLERKMICH